MEDRELIAAIAAGDPVGLAALYDKYAASLYGYCCWMLRDPAQAARALREVFNIAAIHIRSLRGATRLRSWLYRVARDECGHRLRMTSAGLGEAFGKDTAVGWGQAPESAAAQQLILQTLAGLKPVEREVIELSFRHHLDEAELAAVLGLSWSAAHALAFQVRVHLERALGAAPTPRPSRRYCPELVGLLVTWDGQLTPPVRDLAMQHVDYCETCSGRERGALRPEALASLLPLPPLPPELREPVLWRPALVWETVPNGVPMAADQATAPPEDLEPTWPGRQGRPAKLPMWSGIRHNTGAAIAVAAIAIWVAAAVSATLITVTGIH
jgi:RNA polymerase sigma factor (sigma-70 family)